MWSLTSLDMKGSAEWELTCSELTHEGNGGLALVDVSISPGERRYLETSQDLSEAI